MDAESLRMMVDLGLARRDLVSAPDADGRARREDPRAQAAAHSDFVTRKSKITKENGQGDEHAARLRAWNTESTFERDEVTGQLEDRWSGQGHRAALKERRLNYDAGWESVDARYGEERRLYLQQKGGPDSSYALSTPARSGQDGFRNSILGGNRSNTTPRSFSGGHPPRDRGRTAAPPLPAASHARAPSPRSFGTVRFGTGRNRGAEPAPATNRAVSSPVKQAAAGIQSIVATSGSISQAAQATASPPTRSSTVASTAQTTVVELAVVRHDWVNQQKYRNKALFHAANPGQACDDYYKNNPDQLQYFAPARDQLIKEATDLAKHNDALETSRWLDLRKYRTWMVDAAQMAKLQVEQGQSKEQIDAYCEQNPRHALFVEAARNVFTPQDQPKKADASAPLNNNVTKSTVPEANTAASPSISSERSDSGDTTDTTSSTPPPAWAGSLVAYLIDVAGKVLYEYRVGVHAPIQATLRVTAKTQRFNPKELIGAIDTLAQSMMDRSGGLDGARLTDDGLWVED